MNLRPKSKFGRVTVTVKLDQLTDFQLDYYDRNKDHNCNVKLKSTFHYTTAPPSLLKAISNNFLVVKMCRTKILRHDFGTTLNSFFFN